MIILELHYFSPTRMLFSLNLVLHLFVLYRVYRPLSKNVASFDE